MWWGEVLHYTGMGKVGAPKTSSYKLDKIIWLICSGIFYLDDISVGRRFYTICFEGGLILEELEKTLCQKVRYEGLYNIKGLLLYNIKREWSLQRNNVKLEIEIITALNQKAVTMKASKPVKFVKVFELLSEILKYECLYDGRFFPLSKIEIDGEDKTSVVKPHMLSYYSGTRNYSMLSQPMNDTVYKRGFCAWERYNKQLLNVNQMFYYIGFAEGITADLRLALFSEIYEPLSELLSKENKIQLINSKPMIERNERCPACGYSYKVVKSSEPSFNDEITSVVQAYGSDIFAGDDIVAVIKKTVKTRNKMLHVDVKKKETLSGGQCGFYMRKYVEIYRMIVLQQIKMWNTSMAEELKEAMISYNQNFPKLRIRKKRMH